MITDASPVLASTGHSIETSSLFARDFDLRPFSFAHNLSNHALFSFPRLLKLAQDTQDKRPGDVYFDVGQVGIGQRWDETERKKTSIEYVFENISSAGAWIILRRPELDPEYKELLDACMSEARQYIGRDIRRELKVEADSIIFITSPNRVTSYHMDRECSFLMQIRGQKKISIFDRTDQEVLPEEEIERFWTVDNNACRYKQHLEDRARVFSLAPGGAVHIPVNSPHWLQNGDNVSISYNINCQFKDHLRANLYRANYALRRIGLTPKPPGKSAFGDAMKRGTVGAAVWLRSALRRPLGR